MMPTDQTSTLEEIFGGSLPTTKHSGGKYLHQKSRTQTGIHPQATSAALLHLLFTDDKTLQRQHLALAPTSIRPHTTVQRYNAMFLRLLFVQMVRLSRAIPDKAGPQKLLPGSINRITICRAR